MAWGGMSGGYEPPPPIIKRLRDDGTMIVTILGLVDSPPNTTGDDRYVHADDVDGARAMSVIGALAQDLRYQPHASRLS